MISLIVHHKVKFNSSVKNLLSLSIAGYSLKQLYLKSICLIYTSAHISGLGIGISVNYFWLINFKKLKEMLYYHWAPGCVCHNSLSIFPNFLDIADSHNLSPLPLFLISVSSIIRKIFALAKIWKSNLCVLSSWPWISWKWWSTVPDQSTTLVISGSVLRLIGNHSIQMLMPQRGSNLRSQDSLYGGLLEMRAFLSSPGSG